jgi:acetylglutamate kinase
MQHLIEKAAILHEALPYIRRFHGDIFVIKYGGHAMVDPELRDQFARDVVLMKYVGLHPVVVHGGGPQIDETLRSLGAESERVEGLRVTNAQTMRVVEMVLGGEVNQQIVSLICGHGGRAVGLTGKDDGFVVADKVDSMQTRAGNWVDPGQVGRVLEVRPAVVHKLVDGGFIPVIAPVAVDSSGLALNVNADVVAGQVAAAMPARKLVMMTDTEGVRDGSGEIVSSLSAGQAERMREDGTLQGGMIPKVQCALEALHAGVSKAHIIDGRTRHAVLLEIFTDEGVGTEIIP